MTWYGLRGSHEDARLAAPAQEFARELEGTVFRDRVVSVGVVDSTIDACRQLADEGAPEGAVVIAEGQTRGRGQHGRAWFSPTGGSLYVSALLRPPLRPDQVTVLTPLAGLAACEAVRAGLGVPAVIKLPNDLVLPDWSGRSATGWRKLGGVLVDTAVQGTHLRHAIVSLGMNVTLDSEDFPVSLRDVATSLWIETGMRWSIAAVAGAFLRRLDALRREMGRTEMGEAWLAALLARHGDLVRDKPAHAAASPPADTQ